jgi:hypothetical protein
MQQIWVVVSKVLPLPQQAKELAEFWLKILSEWAKATQHNKRTIATFIVFSFNTLLLFYFLYSNNNNYNKIN